MLRCKPKRRNRNGNAIIEFALAFAVIFPMFSGVFELGYAFFAYNRLVNAVRAGARYASLETYGSATSTPPDSFTNAVKNTVVYGNTAGTGKPVTQGFSTSNVILTVVFENNVPARMKVGVTNYRLNAVFGLCTLKNPWATFPYMGRFAPP